MRYKLCFCKRHKENILIPKLAAADEYAKKLERLLDRLEINIVNKIQKKCRSKKKELIKLKF